jgi:RecA-family ATPase
MLSMGYDFDDAGRNGGSARRAGDNAKPYGKPYEQNIPAWRSHAISAAELLDMDFPPISEIVPGFVPEGVCILAGRPKVGKSWLALDLCLGISLGEKVLGNITPVIGDVLYCALEDTPQRLQRRISKLLWPPRDKWSDRLTLATKWRRLDEGGSDDIAEWVGSVPEPRLVVLDTLAGVRPERRRQDTTYDGDYKALIDIHRLANERGFAALVLHHTRKMEADDPLDTISGTLGTIGCADTGMVLAKGAQGASLYVRGRDVEESEHAIVFSGDTCRWSVLGEAAEVRRSEARKKIMAVLLKATESKGPKEIALAAGLSVDVVNKRLANMVEAGEAVQLARGRYAHPNHAFQE